MMSGQVVGSHSLKVDTQVMQLVNGSNSDDVLDSNTADLAAAAEEDGMRMSKTGTEAEAVVCCDDGVDDI